MKFLLLGKGKSIESIKKYLAYKKCNYIQAVFLNEAKNNEVIIDDSLMNLTDIDYVIKSPGISETNKLYLRLAKKFIFINELDLLSIFDEKVKCIVITGSNGKTTLVSMLQFLFKKMKIKSIACGNSFQPITHFYKQFNKVDYLIVEQSSFQLHNLTYYAPYISLILNLQDNHLDHSYSLRSYFENKMKIFKYQNKKHYFIYDFENKKITNLNTNTNIVDLLPYPNMHLINDKLFKYQLDLNYIYTIFKIMSLDIKKIELINNFKTLKYREEVILGNKATYINDSKSTSVDATLFALSHLKNCESTILIVGGKDKKQSFEKLQNVKVFKIICYGEIVDKCQKQLLDFLYAKNLNDAFKIATSLFIENKTILFSPASSSFDQYDSFIQRGKHFERLIKKYEKNRF